MSDLTGSTSDPAGSSAAPSTWVSLAEIARPHGVRGELRLRLYNPDSDILLHQKTVRLTLPSGEVRMETVQSARRANDAILMQLASISDRDVAEPLRGSTIDIPREAFERLAQDEFYAVDVIGARVLEVTEAGEELALGTVKDFVSYPTVDVFVVQHEDGQLLDVPSTEAFVVDVQKGLVRLRGLEVLREIAASSKPKVKKPKPEKRARDKRTTGAATPKD